LAYDNETVGTRVRRNYSIRVPMSVVLLLMTVICFLLIIVRDYKLPNSDYGFLLWNLFLAWLPLIISMLASLYVRIVSRRWAIPGLIVLGVAWLLLFPNAPYLTTDFIHLLSGPNVRRYDYTGLLLWFDIIVHFLFAWCGLFLGYLSTRRFQVIVERYGSRFAGWLFVTVASFLGGFGLYLGRVVRLNSWDALFSPFRLINGIAEGLNKNAEVFTFMFGSFILIVYLSIFALQRDT
jgi:uncharacterized membrane protein